MIAVVGLSHKTAPIELRERLGGGDERIAAMLARLRQAPELEEAVFLSTCNRVEVLVRPSEDSALGMQLAIEATERELAVHAHGSAEPTLVQQLHPHLYQKIGSAAVEHLFRVASSLDSMVLGESQILGQCKSAFDAAQSAGTVHGALMRSFSHAFAVAKRVRHETQIGAGSVSIASAAVDLTERIFGALSQLSVLLVGAGEMGEATLRALGKDARAVRVCNRSVERAQALAAQYGGSAASLDALTDELIAADVVIVSTASDHYVVTQERIAKVMKARRGRTLFFVDISVPRNVDPAIHGADNVFVYNVDDLEQLVVESQRARQRELLQAQQIVGEEVGRWEAWRRGLNVKPTLVALRERTRQVLHAELERTLAGKLSHLGESERRALEQMLDSAANKLLHAPTQQLKREGDDQAQRAETLCALFELQAATVPNPSAAQPERPRASCRPSRPALALGGGESP